MKNNILLSADRADMHQVSVFLHGIRVPILGCALIGTVRGCRAARLAGIVVIVRIDRQLSPGSLLFPVATGMKHVSDTGACEHLRSVPHLRDS